MIRRWNASSSRIGPLKAPSSQTRSSPAAIRRWSAEPLKGPPFEPLQSSSLRVLSLKTALLLTLASLKWVGDLQALSVNPACLEFRPNDSKVVLKTRLGYVPKVLSTTFRTQIIVFSAFSPPAGSQESLLCPVRALKIYIEHSASYRKSEQLFVASVTVLKVALLRSREFLGG